MMSRLNSGKSRRRRIKPGNIGEVRAALHAAAGGRLKSSAASLRATEWYAFGIMVDWQSHPQMYQLFHPWHWLAYGQNAAVVALVGLAAYVYYTKRMMTAAEITRQLTLTPYLIAEIADGKPLIRIINVAASAVHCVLWGQSVAIKGPLNLRLRKPSNVSGQVVSAITTFQPFTFPMIINKPGANVLYVIDCRDTAGGVYQLQILQKMLNSNNFEIESMFSIPTTFASPLTRITNRINQSLLYKRMKSGGSDSL